MLTAYTTFDDIRGVLGVSVEELEDATLQLQIYEDALAADLDEISLDLESMYQTVSGLASPSATQSRFLRDTRSFATHSVARTLLTSLPMFGPRSVEDGKARMERFDNPYRDMVKAVNGDYERWRNRLQQTFTALGQSTTVSAPRTYLSVVAPSSDPIAGT